MTDIVERLKTTASVRSWAEADEQREEAADEIERLRAEVVEYERWQREMVADYRLIADDHRVGRQSAINFLIHELRAEVEALRAELAAERADRRRLGLQGEPEAGGDDE